MQQTTHQMPDKSKPLRDQLETIAATPPVWTKDAYGNHFAWMHLGSPLELKAIAEALAGQVRLCTITAYAEERDDTDKRRRIAYHFAGGRVVLTVTVPIYDPESLQKLPVPSITPWFRNADWNEREFREMFNIDIEGHPNPKRLFLDERLDAGIMANLIPFSAMANSAGTNTLWERILEAKGVPPEERLPSFAAPSEPIKLEPSFTPVASAQSIEPSLATPTLANVAKLVEEADRALGRKKGTAAGTDSAKPKGEAPNIKDKAKPAPETPVSAGLEPDSAKAPLAEDKAQPQKKEPPAPVASKASPQPSGAPASAKPDAKSEQAATGPEPQTDAARAKTSTANGET